MQTLTPCQRARAAARAGYALSENIYAPGLYEVRKPDGTVYQVDAANPAHPTCNCPASVTECKHVALVQICRRYWLALQVRAAAQNKPVHRSRFSLKHLAQLRAFQPTLTAPAPIPLTPEQAARKARVKAMMERDFGGVANT